MNQQRFKTRKSWRGILPVSLALNLFFVAVIAGHILRVRLNEHAASEPPLMRALENARTALSASDAAAFTAAIRRNAPHYMPAVQQLNRARDELETQITAEPYNPDAVRQALVAWQTSWNGFMNDFSSPLVDALAQVSPEGRRNLIAVRRKGSLGLGPP